MSDEAADRAIELAFRHLSELDTLHIYGDNARASMLAYGWWARVTRTGEALRQLHAGGFDHESAPLVRTILDHTTALVWLAQKPDEAVAAYEWHRAWKQSGLVATAEKLAWELEVDGGPEAPAREDRPAVVFDPALMAKEIGWADLYMGFQVETSFVHPSVPGAETYYRIEEHEIVPNSEPQEPGRPLRTTAMFVGLATRALVTVLEDENPGLAARPTKSRS